MPDHDNKILEEQKAAGSEFEYKILEEAPGGHFFDRLDTKLAKEARAEIYLFLARYLRPPSSIESLRAARTWGA